MTEQSQENSARKRSNPKTWIAAAILVVVVTALAVGSGVLWHKVIRERIFPKRWGVVDQNSIYRSGRIHPALIEDTLKKNNIKTIVNLCGHGPKEIPEKEAAEKLGVQVVYCPLGGKGTGDPQSYLKALETILEAKKQGTPVLVHCAAGTQRTGGVVALYRILAQHKNVKEVLEEMKQYDFDPDDNPKLIPYLNEHIEFIAEKLKEKGAIERVPENIPRIEAEG